MCDSTTLLFRPGIVTTSPAALEVLAENNVRPADLLARHIGGDWPDMERDERMANVDAVLHAPTLIIGRYVLDAIGMARVTLISEPECLTLIVTEREAVTILHNRSNARVLALPNPRRQAPALVGPRAVNDADRRQLAAT